MFPLNVSTIGLLKMMKSHKGYIYLTCLPFDIDCNSFPDSSFCHISGSQTTHFRSKSSQSRPRFSRLPFWPAGFILPPIIEILMIYFFQYGSFGGSVSLRMTSHKNKRALAQSAKKSSRSAIYWSYLNRTYVTNY